MNYERPLLSTLRTELSRPTPKETCPQHPVNPVVDTLRKGMRSVGDFFRNLFKSAAKELDLPWGERKKSYNSRIAQELGKWAETKGKGDTYHDIREDLMRGTHDHY
jgi:predicted DsbA family dithiol-disulfide isomerase